ncbi:MAG: hypothetical protein ACXAAH_14345 [Promethearchaeota archaeon]|jgi:hypothetical protein
MSNSSSIISLNITQFPQNILIPGVDNGVSIQVTNNSAKNEKFKFIFEGENLAINLGSEELRDHIEFTPNETKNIDLKLTPKIDGFGKLTINAYWLKIIEYTVKVQKVRESVPKSKSKAILENYAFRESKKFETLNPKDYIIDITLKELQRGEEQLTIMESNYKSSLSADPASLSSSPEVTLGSIDENIRKLAKGYFSNNNILKALEFALKLSDPAEQINLYSKLIRAFAFENLDDVISTVKNLQDQKIKQDLFMSIVLDQISVDPVSVIKLAESSEDTLLKFKILLNITKKFHEENKSSELSNILNLIIDSLSKLLEINNEKKTRKRLNDILVDVLCLLAEVESPSVVHGIIEGFSQQDLKEKITKDIFDTIYVFVDEIQTKIESELAFSQFFLLNSYVSNINNEIKRFSNTGGNVSNNILSGDFNFKLAFLSLFSFNFSIFPIIDRIYNEVKYNLKKSMGYYVFPSIENYQNEELTTLKITLNQFFRNFNNLSNQLHIFNLDFIPYLGKPTIILSSESHLNEILKSKIHKLGDKVNLIIDDAMFKGGKIYDSLQEIFPPAKCEIINLLLSYEFINDYNLLIEFIQTLF